MLESQVGPQVKIIYNPRLPQNISYCCSLDLSVILGDFFERGTYYWKNQSGQFKNLCPKRKMNMVGVKAWSMQMPYLAVINRRAFSINNLKQCFRQKSQPWAHRNLPMIVIIKKTSSRADKILHNILSPQKVKQTNKQTSCHSARH